MSKKHLLVILSSCVLSIMPHTSDAASIPSYLESFDYKDATVKTAIWDDLTTSRLDPDGLGTYGKNPGRTSTIWPTSNTILANKGSAVKTATLGSHSIGTDSGVGGGPYIGSRSLHFGSRRALANANGGTLSIKESSVLENVQTLVLQLWTGEALGHDLFGTPSLYLNGGTTAYSATFSSPKFYQHDTGDTFDVEGVEHPIYQNLNVFQWDLSSFDGPILSFELRWSGVENSGVYAIQLDQIDTVFTQAVPEPTTWYLFAAAGFTVMAVRRKRFAKKA